ncbi:MAG: hypothetical protein ACR2PZ_19665 [Pseudomonadales bacterium]
MTEEDPLADAPFSFTVTQSERVIIYARGKQAKVLKGRQASRFIERLARCDPKQAQIAMAAATGQFKFGNER